MEGEKDNKIKDENIGQEINSRFLKFIALKSEKLTQATYMVTSFISDSEPIKWRLRENVLDLLSDTSMLNPGEVISGGLSDKTQISPLFKLSVLESVLNSVEKITSLLQVAVAGNFVSEMNFSILAKEFINLKEVIKTAVNKDSFERLISSESILSSGSMLPSESSERNDSSLKNLPTTFQHLLNRQTGSKDTNLSLNQLKGQIENKGTSFGNLSDKIENRNVLNKKSSKPKESRKDKILSFLQGKDWTSIKDISDAIDDCSTKTIQRELSDLVQKGVLKKKGDRRWSRYVLS